jgi:hypothetical protein
MSGRVAGALERARGMFPTLLTRSPSAGAEETDLTGERDRLAEQLAAASAAQDERMRRLADERHDASLGYPEAADRAAELQRQVDAGAAEVDALAKDLGAVNGKIVERERERQAEAERERPHAQARLAVEYLERTACTQQLAEQFGDALRAQMETGAKLNAVLAAPIRALGDGAIDERLRHTLRKYFAVTRPVKPNVPPEMRPAPYFGLIPADAINPASPFNKMEPVEAEQQLLDNCVHLFRSRPEAEAARWRRDPAGGSVHVRPRPDGLFELVQGTLRGAAKDAAGTEETP